MWSRAWALVFVSVEYCNDQGRQVLFVEVRAVKSLYNAGVYGVICMCKPDKSNP